MISIRVESAAFDPGAEANRFRETLGNAGAMVTFTGVVRDDTGTLEAMEIEHYPGMTETAIGKIAEEAIARFSLLGVFVIHRFGPLLPGEDIMMVATGAKHRADAFAGAEFLMDYLKSRAPFWKKEITRDGSDWVSAKETDEDALSRWQD